MRWSWETWCIPPTRLAPLRLTTHLPNSVAVAITAVLLVMEDFVPGFSYLVESPGLWFLALICWSKGTTSLVRTCIKSEMRCSYSPMAQPINRQTHQQRRTSSGHVPLRSRCSSSCSPLCGVWKIPGSPHSKCHRRCTGLLTEQEKDGSKHHLVYWEGKNWQKA